MSIQKQFSSSLPNTYFSRFLNLRWLSILFWTTFYGIILERDRDTLGVHVLVWESTECGKLGWCIEWEYGLGCGLRYGSLTFTPLYNMCINELIVSLTR